MVVLKCKMCGGELKIEEGNTVCECEYCGSRQTVPNADNEKKMNLFARANRLRFGCQFDKASGVYESIIADFPEEAEAYWGLVLCKYGIEYVDDPATGKKIPTCHRSSFDSVMEDENFDLVMENADAVSKRVYREEAKQIEELRKGIIEVSSKEEPDDIFICYKETDEDGNRTLDSVLAQDIYDALTEKGYRVFFSRITLEDKLGQEYEPYIFAALHSAKVMLAIGTQYEYYDAVWVKNEWSRFLQLIASGEKKTLIPCYKNLDAYDMPKEFARLQAQDLGKVGAIQDLLRGISKIIKIEEKKQEVKITQVQQAGPNVTALLQRGNMALEDGEWEFARKYYDDVLNMDAKCADAYLGLAMADLKTRTRIAFENHFRLFEIQNRNYDRAKQFSDEKLNLWFKKCEEQRDKYNALVFLKNSIHAVATIKETEERKERIYKEACEIMESAVDTGMMKLAVEEFSKISEYKDSDERKKQLLSEIKAIVDDYQRKKDEEKRKAEEELRKKEEEHQKKIQKITAKILHLQEERKGIINQIQKKENELSKLGLFKAKEKEILKVEIQKLNELETSKKNEIAEVLSSLGVRGLNGKVGDTVYMGHWPADDQESIAWKIVATDGEKKLLITQKAILTEKYNEYAKDVTWETSSVRSWLNNEFYTNAFSEYEKEMLLKRTVTADKNPRYKTNPGEPTMDNVFLLSIKETEQYFKTSADRKAKATDYAVKTGAETQDGYSRWWLRTPGRDSKCAAAVYSVGSIDGAGETVNRGSITLRPAIWIEL